MVDTNGESSAAKENNNSITPTPTTNQAQTPTIPHDASNPPETSERIATTELEKPYLYQNRKTGQPSTSPLTARQLCRLLCPAVNGSILRSTTMLVTPETLVIGYDISTGQYSSDGWMAARHTPVLREACSSWHYEDRGNIQGPVSCRDLATVIIERRSHNKKEESVNAWENVRVWSTEMAAQIEKEEAGGNSHDNNEQTQQWKKISQLVYLKVAMEAFEDTPPPWELGGARQSDSAAKGGQAAPTMALGGEFDPSIMTFDAGADVSAKDETDSAAKQSGEDKPSDGDGTSAPSNNLSKSEAEELEAFLSSTASMGPAQRNGNAEDDDDEEEGYESDGGTSYVKDPRTGNWIHAALAPQPPKPKPPSKEDAPSSSNDKKAILNNNTNSKKRKRKKANFAAKNAKCWVYVTGLPKDTNEDEVATYFARVGVLDLDPSSQHPKVKLYREKDGERSSIKGDASICYARPESVDMALQFLDDSLFRADSGADRIKVQRAKFEQHGEQFHANKGRFSNAQRKVARLAALQAVGWDEGENGRITGGKKGLRIIVLKNMFHPDELVEGGGAADKEDAALMELEKEVHSECEKYGAVEKITVFSKNPSGVMIVKFAQPGAASDAISEYHGRTRKGRKVDASFWDGVTDYTTRDVEKEQKELDQRHDEFGNWLESQEVPEEFQLKVEGDS